MDIQTRREQISQELRKLDTETADILAAFDA
jgi:hypothetical protein